MGENFSTAPPISVFSPDRRNCWGTIANPIQLTKTINFNAASEMQFSIAEKYYNENKCTWVRNPLYDKLVEDTMLYVPDDTAYFSFPRYSCHPEDITYELLPNTDQPIRDGKNMEMTYSPKGLGFELQPETLLFDIGSESGYTFTQRAYLGTAKGSTKGVYCYSPDNQRLGRLLACEAFIPVQQGDVVYLRSCQDKDYEGHTGSDTQLKKWTFSYHVCYYTEADSVSVTNEYPSNGYINTYIPHNQNWTGSSTGYTFIKGKLYKYNLGEDGTRAYTASEYGEHTENRDDGYVHPAYQRFFPDVRIPIKNQLGEAKSGYMRVSMYIAGDHFYTETYTDEDNTTHTDEHYVYPSVGFIRVYSGERRCSKINTAYLDGKFEPKLKWFTIADIDEVDDGICKIKTVKAYSAEYVLHKKNFSLAQSTLPLYIPPQLQNLVQSNNWVIDKTNVDGVKENAQIMKLGLLNEVLKYLPNWKLGYISPALLTRYRTVGDIDNANLYSFLMNDIQSIYQCYFVFDTENHTISAYTKDNLMGQSPVYFSWDNVIKELNITNSDSKYITALSVHTSEDKYGLGVVNPTGNNTVYDFTYPCDHGWLDFVADTSKNRTLKEALQSWQTEFNSRLNAYKNLGNTFIRLQMQEVKLTSQLALALADYRSKADEINVYIRNDYQESDEVPLNYIIGDQPRTTESMTSGRYRPKNKYANYHSRALYQELLDLTKKYYIIKTELETARETLVTTQSQMKSIATTLSLSYRTTPYKYTNPQGDVVVANPILSEDERKALDFYITEGDWTHSNMVFSETYDSYDIYSTLVDTYNDAQRDLSLRLNKPIYEFGFNMANPFELSEMKKHLSTLRLGHICNLEVEPGVWVSPTLLSIFIDYSQYDKSTLSFSTDYNRKPLQNRFADLFNTITPTGVKESSFKFEE